MMKLTSTLDIVRQRIKCSNFSRSGLALALVLTSGLALAACGNSKANSESSSSEGGNGGLVYADNWFEIAIDANLAKTKVTSTGHFTTTRNACARPADGAMSLQEWNSLATTMNQAIKNYSAAAPKQCFDIDYRACMDGNVEAVLDNGKHVPLFESGGGGTMCTRLQDLEGAKALYKSINGITFAADQADCTLGYERCSR